jgi:VanZ family protein
MAVFGVLALLLWLAIGSTTAGARAPLLALALAAAYAVTDELHQGFVPGRHPSVVDVVIDAIGAAIAVSIVALVAARRARPLVRP